MADGRLEKDKNDFVAQLFYPKAGISITASYTPEENLMISPVEAITMTLDGVTKEYNTTDVFGLAKGVAYTFGAGFNAHRM